MIVAARHTHEWRLCSSKQPMFLSYSVKCVPLSSWLALGNCASYPGNSPRSRVVLLTKTPRALISK